MAVLFLPLFPSMAESLLAREFYFRTRMLQVISGLVNNFNVVFLIKKIITHSLKHAHASNN